jgi:Protein of unknown function (DUF3300)
MPRKPLAANSTRLGGVLAAVLLLASAGPSMFAQDASPPPPGQTLTADQLDDLVAPIALYPDPLLSQVLVAATYPLEVVEAFQWIQKNPGLAGPALTQAAQQQNWDPSVQALVVFPDVLKRLNDDVTWTTNLGNAFLAQQQDVMDAVQRMRQQAQQAGKLASTPQENVVSENQDGQPYIEIVPADPDVIYVPCYDPVWIWGPARWYPYPHWWWPPSSVIVGGVGFGFYGGIHIDVFFGGGWRGWNGWGWHPGWGNHTVIVNNTFVHRYNFNTANIRDVHGTTVWTHDAAHRQGVPYANPALQQRFRADVKQNVAPRPEAQPARAPAQPAERLGSRQIPKSTPPAQNRSAFSGSENSGAAARAHADHGYSSMGPARSMPAARPAPAPRSAPASSGRRGR